MTVGMLDLRGGGGERGHVFGPDGLLEPERFIFLDHLRESDGVGGAQPSVDLEQHVNIGADGLAHGADALGSAAEFVHSHIAAPLAGDGVELERREAALNHRPRAGLQFLEVVHLGPAVGVDAEPVAHSPTE